MSKRVSRKNTKSIVKPEIDSKFKEGIIYFAEFIFTLASGSKKTYQTAFSLRSPKFRIDSTASRLGIKESKEILRIQVIFIKKISSYEQKKGIGVTRD